MIFEAKILFHHAGDDRRNAAELGVTKGVTQALVCKKTAVAAAHALRHHHRTVAEALDLLGNQCHEPLAVESDFGEKNHDGDLGILVACHPPGRRDPAGVASHHLKNEDLGRGLCHGSHIKTRFAGRDSNVFGDRSETRTVIRYRQIIIDGFGNMDGLDRIARCL